MDVSVQMKKPMLLRKALEYCWDDFTSGRLA